MCYSDYVSTNLWDNMSRRLWFQFQMKALSAWAHLPSSQTKQYSAEYHYRHFKHFHQLRTLDQLNCAYEFNFKHSHFFLSNSFFHLPWRFKILFYTFLLSELIQWPVTVANITERTLGSRAWPCHVNADAAPAHKTLHCYPYHQKRTRKSWCHSAPFGTRFQVRMRVGRTWGRGGEAL